MCISSDVAFRGDPAPYDRFLEQKQSWAAKRRRSRKLGLDPAAGCNAMGLAIASAPAAAPLLFEFV